MMINKRLIGTVSESKKYIVGNVAVQWCSLAANMAMMTSVTGLLASLYTKEAEKFRRITMKVLTMQLNSIMDLCQCFGQKKSKDYAAFLRSASSFCCGVM